MKEKKEPQLKTSQAPQPKRPSQPEPLDTDTLREMSRKALEKEPPPLPEKFKVRHQTMPLRKNKEQKPLDPSTLREMSREALLKDLSPQLKKRIEDLKLKLRQLPLPVPPSLKLAKPISMEPI